MAGRSRPGGVFGRVACGESLHLREHRGDHQKVTDASQAEFGRLTKDDPRFDLELRAFLGRTFNLKALADYETGPGSHVSPRTRPRSNPDSAAIFGERGELPYGERP